MHPSTDDRLRVRTPPDGARLALRQRWEDLLFLHWEVSPDEIQRRLPPGLTVDTWEGRGLLGVVPFFMRGVRPPWFCSVPWVSSFLELNVRTYVFDAAGVPGVWFFSLDANQPIAVEVARRWYRLPYQHASMSASQAAGHIQYRCRRRGQSESACYRYTVAAGGESAAPGSFEFFLFERYVLYSFHPGRRRLYRGFVAHEPYRYTVLEPTNEDTTPLLWEGFDVGDALPVHAASAPGFDVDAYAIEPVDAAPLNGSRPVRESSAARTEPTSR